MRIATVSLALTVSLTVALVFAGPVVAQDATKSDASNSAATKQPDASSDRHKSRAERRAEAAKTEADAKSQTLTEFPKADSAAAANTKPAKPKIECRKQEVTGSRMGKNVCATPEQWAQADEQALEAVRQMRSEAGSKAGQAALGGPYTSGGQPEGRRWNRACGREVSVKSSLPADRFLKPFVVLLIVLLAGPEVFAVIELTTLLELVGATLFLLAFSAAFKLLGLSILDAMRRVALPSEFLAMIRMRGRPDFVAVGLCLVAVNGVILLVIGFTPYVLLSVMLGHP
jgi:hypothetical protein